VFRNFRLSPGPQIHSVQHQAKHVGRYETELFSSQPYDANNDAINCCQDPALPTSTADQDGGDNGQHARDIIQTKRHDATSISIIEQQGRE